VALEEVNNSLVIVADSERLGVFLLSHLVTVLLNEVGLALIA
jgi:hypothetical protein